MHPSLAMLHLQMEIECKGFDEGGDMVRIPGSTPDGISRFKIIEYPGGVVRYFRHDAPGVLRERLGALSDAQLFSDFAFVRGLVDEAMGAEDAFFAGKTYTFERQPEAAECPDAVRLDDSWAITAGGRKLSMATSACRNNRAAELGIETLAEFRCRGYGRQVATAWARQVLGEGRVGFYSHRLDNTASEAMADT